MSKALKTAIEANDPEATHQALKGVKDVNRKLPGAKAPLLHACALGADKVLEALFEAGAIAAKRNTFPGDTPFAVAADHRQFGVMKRLLELQQAAEEAVVFVLENACMDGRASVVEFVLQHVKPRISIELFRLASISSGAPALLKLLVQHGGDLKARHDTMDAKGMTPLHELAGRGKSELLRTLVECGADVNARDDLGRTPLMVLASGLEGIEVGNQHARITQQSLASGEARLLSGEAPRTVNCLEAVRTLLELGADATLADHAGNDAIDHCAFEYFRCRKKPAPKILVALRDAGAKGNRETLDLFVALRRRNLAAVCAAIRDGADVNHLTPPPVPFTPLTWAAGASSIEALKIVRALLKAHADPNKPCRGTTPLIEAARCGNLPVVMELVAAGAQIQMACESGESVENAYSAAEGKEEVRDFLKSRGAVNPRHSKSGPLKPGVGSWNDFSDLLVNTTADKAAEALAKIIDGRMQSNVHGQTFSPGRQAFVVIRPSGMDWCNVLQIAPPRLRSEDSNAIEAFAANLAKTSGASVLSIDYNDTADAASVLHVEPDGKKTRDDGWDREMLEEMVGAMGAKAPAWARNKLASTSDNEPSSTERLVQMAERENFLVATFGLNWEPGRKLDVEFTGHGPETFDGVAFVSN